MQPRMRVRSVPTSRLRWRKRLWSRPAVQHRTHVESGQVMPGYSLVAGERGCVCLVDGQSMSLRTPVGRGILRRVTGIAGEGRQDGPAARAGHRPDDPDDRGVSVTPGLVDGGTGPDCHSQGVADERRVQDWQWIVAHELAHVRRRDYLVRWVEWLACVCFWWNPVVWWAQRNLRAMEEICCDDLVLSTCTRNRSPMRTLCYLPWSFLPDRLYVPRRWQVRSTAVEVWKGDSE